MIFLLIVIFLVVIFLIVSSLLVTQEGMTLAVEIFNLAGLKRQVFNDKFLMTSIIVLNYNAQFYNTIMRNYYSIEQCWYWYLILRIE